jgi:hypothetical protein
MDEEQLAQVEAGTGDATTLALVQEQRNLNERIRNSQVLSQSLPEGTIQDQIVAQNQGIAAAPIPESMFGDTAVGERYAPAEEEEASPAMARGGIVAFAKGKEVKAPVDDVSAFRAIDTSKAVMTEEERLGAEEKGLARLEKFLGPDRSIELAEKVAKASELGPQAESRAKAAAAFEMMAAFGEAVPFATALGKAGAAAGRNMKEFEKLKRESEKEANKLRLDTARYERAEKMQRYGEANKIAQQMEDRKAKLAALEIEKSKTLADIQTKREATASSEKVGMAQVAVQRAGLGKLDFNREILKNKVNEFTAAFVQKNGRQPTPQEQATITGLASDAAAKLLKVDPYGAVRAGTSQANVIQDEIKEIDAALKGAALGMPLPEGTTVATLQARRAEAQRRYEAALSGAGGTTTPPPATTQSLQPGQIVVDANGNRAKYVGGDPKDPKSYAPV